MVSQILVSIGSGNGLLHDGPLAITWITAELLSVRSWTIQLKAIALEMLITWWRHQMETFSTLLAICAGNSQVTGEFPAQMASDAELWCFLWSTSE